MGQGLVCPGQWERNLHKVSRPTPPLPTSSPPPAPHASRARSSPFCPHGFLPHRAAAALRAISARRVGDILANPFGTFALPPRRPSATAAGSFLFAITHS